MYTLSPSDINTLLDATQLVTTKKEQQSLTVMLVQDIPVDMMKRAQYIATL